MYALSILIPTYNNCCLPLVKALVEQAEAIADLTYEVLVAEDGSTDSPSLESNRPIGQLAHCRHIEREKNVGRAAIRNFLAREAQYEYVLFIDSHMSVVRSDYLMRYLALTRSSHALVYGGYTITRTPPEGKGNLRYAYELSCIDAQSAENRSRQPYQNFHTSNFMVRRDIILSHPLDERFKHYGYEDVLLGKALLLAGIHILHIDNPVGFDHFESNGRFMEKTDEALSALHTFRAELQGYSRLLALTDRLGRWHLTPLISGLYRLTGKAIRRRLSGSSPTPTLFKVYKLLRMASLHGTP